MFQKNKFSKQFFKKKEKEKRKTKRPIFTFNIQNSGKQYKLSTI